MLLPRDHQRRGALDGDSVPEMDAVAVEGSIPRSQFPPLASSAVPPRAPRRELWYPPPSAMGRFNEAADPQMALAARAERPRVLAGLHDSTKWPGIPTS